MQTEDGERRVAWLSRPSSAHAVVVGALLVVAAAVYGPYVADSGFTSDDWANADSVARRGFGGAVESQLETLGSKPLLALLLPLPHAVFGSSPVPHLVLGILLAVSVSVLLYALLVRLGAGRLPSAAIAVLVLLFPWSDSSRLWATGAVNNVALCLYLLGALVAFRGLRARGRRAVLTHASAAALYAASILTYETAMALALLTGALYLTAAPPRAALWRWAVDAVAVGAAIAYTAATTVKSTVPLADQLAHIPRVAKDAGSLWGDVLLPFGVPAELAAAVTLLVLAIAIAQATGRAGLRAGGPDQRRWLFVAAAAVVAIALAYVVYVPSGYWRPRMEGLENRVNLLAALPLSVLAYAVLVLAFLIPSREAWRRRAVPAATVAALLVAGGYLAELRIHQDRWVQAHEQQRSVLATIERTVGPPPAGSTVLVFGQTARVAPGVPVFYDNWDLNGALRLRWPDRSFHAYPVLSGSVLECGPDSLELVLLDTPSATEIAPADRSVAYERAVLVDIERGTALRVESPGDCRGALARLTFGRFDPPPPGRGAPT